MIIAFAGQKGSGKDTCAQLVQERLKELRLEARNLSFAEPLKHVCFSVFGASHGVPEEVFFGTQKEKEKDLAKYGLPGQTGRKILQSIGTEGFRSISSDVWSNICINAAHSHLSTGASVVTISDCRFEAADVKAAGGVVIKIERDLRNTDRHSSEAAVAGIKADYYVDNNTTVEQLRLQIVDILSSLGIN